MRKIPSILKHFKDEENELKERGVFLYSIIISGISILSIIIILSYVFGLRDVDVLNYNQNMFICFFILLVICFIALWLLSKGKFVLSAHLITLASFTTVWASSFFDTHTGVIKINSLLFIFPLLTILPMLIVSKRTFILYGIIDLFLVVFFIFYLNSIDSGFQANEIYDTFIIGALATFLVILVQYRVFEINEKLLSQANVIIKEKKKVAQELREHKKKLEDEVIEKTKDLKNTQSQLYQAEKMASLGTLTAGVAHEINNPLNYMMGSYEGLVSYFKENGSEDDKTTQILLDSFKAGIDRTTKIIKSLDQFSQNSKKSEVCNIHSIIDNCLSILENKISERIKISKTYCEKAKNIQGNTGKLHQMFLNIIMNATQSIKENTTGEITINTYCLDKKVKIEISDTGCGIEENKINHIIDPFYTTKSPGEGTGLGLSIAYSIINEHNGTIKFESKINQGTLVIIEFPSLN